MPLATALALAATPTNAASCPPDRAVYALEFDNNQMVYTQESTESGGDRKKRVKFEARKDDKPVWSIDGEIYCDDVFGLCTLNLDGPAGAKQDPSAESCAKFTIAVTEIPKAPDSDEIVYIAFGGLPQFSLACRKVIDLRVLDRKRFAQLEKEQIIFLPPYFRFSSCNR